MIKKFISAALAACITITGLTGCVSKTALPKAGTGQSTSTPGKEEKTVPMGRYGEHTIDFPVLDTKETPLSIVQNGDKQLELFTSIEGNTKKRYLYDGTTWVQQERAYLDEINQNPALLHFIYGQDGNRYALYPDENYVFHLLKFEEGEPNKQLLEEEFAKKTERGYAKLMPDAVSVTEDGTLLLSNQKEVYAYSQTGELLYTLNQAVSDTDWKNSVALSGNTYITVDETNFLKYQLPLKEGQIAETIPFQNVDTDRYNVPIAVGEDGGIYIVNPGGIHHISSGGSMWETIVDGKLNSLSMPSLEIGELFLDLEGGFYVTGYEKSKLKLLHYQYDPDMPAVPSRQLTVYGLNLVNQDTIRQAASMFQIANPDVKVELIDGGLEAGGVTKADVIRALNTELLNGNGADVLMLDGLPVESYIEKGVLADVRDVIKPLKDSGQLLPKIADTFIEEDGAVYQMAARVEILVVYGDQTAIDSLTALDSLKAYQSVSGNLPVKAKNSYDNLLLQMVELYYPELVDETTKELVPGKTLLLLETVKMIGEANGSKVSFDDDEEDGMGRIYNRKAVISDGFIRSEFEPLDLGKISVSIDKVGGISDILLPLAVTEKHGWSLQGVNRLFVPEQILGINQNSPNLDLAKEFMSFVLSEEVQNKDLSDGLPVNTKSADNWGSLNYRGNYTVGIMGEGYELFAEWPSAEMAGGLMEILKQAEVPVMMDHVLVEIILDESRGFFEGTKSAKEAAQAVENKAKIYFAE